MQKLDIKIGDKFGHFSIVENPYKEGKHWKVKCQCDCGQILIKYCGNIKQLTQCKKCTGKHYRKHKPGENKYDLLLLAYDESSKHGHTQVKVQCKCGKIKIIDSRLFGINKTCGCIRSKLGYLHPSYKGLQYISSTYFSQIQLNAQKRKLGFNLTLQYLNELFIHQNKKCALSGLLLTMGSTKCKPSASLDRIDSKKGYLKGNVQWVNKDINRMKSDFSTEYFKYLCQLITNYKL